MADGKTTWRKLITRALEANDEKWSDVVHWVLGPNRNDDEWTEPEFRSQKSLDAKFFPGYGSIGGCAFTLWTRKRVYFPCDYDGSEYVESVPRDPCGEAKEHA